MIDFKPIESSFRFMDPEQILTQVGINEGSIVADLGCGSGYLTLEASKRVGEEGTVYAVDVQKSVLNEIESKVRLYGARNIKLVWADLEILGSTKIPDNSVDLAILANVLFQSKKHKEIFSEVKRILKPQGKLLIIDWKKTSAPMGPDVSLRISEDDIRKNASKMDLKFINSVATDDFHFGLVFEK